MGNILSHNPLSKKTFIDNDGMIAYVSNLAENHIDKFFTECFGVVDTIENRLKIMNQEEPKLGFDDLIPLEFYNLKNCEKILANVIRAGIKTNSNKYGIMDSREYKQLRNCLSEKCYQHIKANDNSATLENAKKYIKETESNLVDKIVPESYEK